MLQAGLAPLGKGPPEPAVQRRLGQFQRSSGTGGALGSATLKDYAAEQDLPVRPARLPTPWQHRLDACPSGMVLAPVNEQALPKQP